MKWRFWKRARCGAVVGPVWKADGESWVCVLARGHRGDHDGGDGTWWVDAVSRHLLAAHEEKQTYE